MTPEEKLAAIAPILEAEFGLPRREKRDPLKILIKTVLSQNTNDKNRDLAFDRLMKEFPDWEELSDAPSSQIAHAIRPGGLQNQKADRIKGILSFIKDNFLDFDISPLCRLSLDEAEKRLTALPGIGVKTLAILMLFSCGKEVFPVDTHIHRIMRRLGMVPDKATAEKTFRLLRGKVARGKSYSLHLNLIKLGRTICRPRKPDCLRCPISSFCLYYVGNKEVIK